MATQCASCGTEVLDGAAVCTACSGAVSPPELQIPPVAETAAGLQSAAPNAAAVSVPAFTTDTDLVGIGGWLIPHVLGLAIAPLFCMTAIFQDFRVLADPRLQAGLAARPGIATLLLFEGSTNVIMLMALIGLNVLFYRTRRSFPRLMITFLIGAFILTLVDHLWTMRFHSSITWTGVFQRLVAALIWVPYFLRSRRVEQTFVN